MPSSPISFGICVYPIQALDVIGFIDVLTNLTTIDVAKYGYRVPGIDLQTLLDASLDIVFHWASRSMDPVECTGRTTLQPTCTYADCPKLDYLLIGGPDPDRAIGDSVEVVSLRGFVTQQEPKLKKIFTTCTGALTLASTGLLDGHGATVNHFFIPWAKTNFPLVKWISDKNWVEGDKFWTASGALAGMDMAGEWVRQVTETPELLYLTTMVLDWRPRDVNGKSVDHYDGNSNLIRGPC